MLAREGQILNQGKVLAQTPLLVPSFSSKGFSDLKRTIKYMSAFIDGSTLISAYDIYYKKVAPSLLTFPKFIFLDSGGYEARVEHDFSETYGREYDPETWKVEYYESVLEKWSVARPTIAISFDNPKRHSALEKQVKSAKALFSRFSKFIPELLLKPARKGEFINVEDLVPLIEELKCFSVLGVTERELGNRMMDRRERIARLRQIMDAVGMKTPIHIFGSLDTLSTALYFISGADIFDGLTWLRFGYIVGNTLYSQNYGATAVENGILQDYRDLSTRMWKDNYYYLDGLRSQMINFARGGGFGAFKHIGAHLEAAFEQLKARLAKEG